MKDLVSSKKFRRDLKRIKKRDYELDLLAVVIDLLRNDKVLYEKYRDHALQGEWGAFRECHIKADWLLIYQATETELLLARTGTHADLFE